MTEPRKIEKQRLDGVEFHDCAMPGALFDNINLAGARFHNVNLSDASLDNVNLSNLTIVNANIEGLTIEGYDIHALLQPYAGARRQGRLMPTETLSALDPEQQAARNWFEALRTRICAEFEAIEREAGSDASFDYLSWWREQDGAKAGPIEEGGGGGGVRGVMKGKVFEKVGVNVSTVGGAFAPDFAKTIHGAGEENPGFFATGISLVAHMANPHVPAVHMNTRMLVTTKRWFGGGADLNPPIVYDEDRDDFHAAFKAACDASDPAHYPRFKTWADDYFYIPHRGVHRGVGGIFYDHLESEFDANFAFTRAVGEAFLDVFPRIVRRRMGIAWTQEEEAQLLEWRGRYVEFNLVHDRGTLFGLKTGGNIDAILMSLPPRVTWG